MVWVGFWVGLAFRAVVIQIVIRRVLVAFLVVALLSLLLPANYRKICLPRLVRVVAALVVVVDVVVVVVVRALLDNCVQTTSSLATPVELLELVRRFGPSLSSA